ncbi:MAG TPA: riboflavin synthase [Planctomycetota bacterium]|jgi:riboflavin synthase|nr:riboflavin synthase [Planctomycetota bacterium]
MFTGIVEKAASVVSAEEAKGGLLLKVDLGPVAEGVRGGDSICVAGACLTVISLEESIAGFDLSPETLEKTRFREIVADGVVNVERALRVGDRLGGHFVSGHVDGLGKVLNLEVQEEFSVHTYQAPPELFSCLVPKGSVTVEGVSLTIAELRKGGVFTVALIPETLERTTLSRLSVGDGIHLEGDLLAKFVQRVMECREENQTQE